MKRRLVRICVFLVLGAIVNVAVAWGLSVFAPIRISVTHQGVMSLDAADPPVWQNSVSVQFGALLVDAEAWRYPRTEVIVYESGVPVLKDGGPVRVILNHPLPAWSATNEAPTDADVARSRKIREIAYGWPMLTTYMRDGSWRVNVLWMGAVVNSATYSAALALVALTWQAIGLQRRSRRRRGLCPKCAYDLRGNVAGSACPECGATR